MSDVLQWMNDALDELRDLRADTWSSVTVAGRMTGPAEEVEAEQMEIDRLDRLIERGEAAVAAAEELLE